LGKKGKRIPKTKVREEKKEESLGLIAEGGTEHSKECEVSNAPFQRHHTRREDPHAFSVWGGKEKSARREKRRGNKNQGEGGRSDKEKEEGNAHEAGEVLTIKGLKRKKQECHGVHFLRKYRLEESTSAQQVER